MVRTFHICFKGTVQRNCLLIFFINQTHLGHWPTNSITLNFWLRFHWVMLNFLHIPDVFPQSIICRQYLGKFISPGNCHSRPREINTHLQKNICTGLLGNIVSTINAESYSANNFKYFETCKLDSKTGFFHKFAEYSCWYLATIPEYVKRVRILMGRSFFSPE